MFRPRNPSAPSRRSAPLPAAFAAAALAASVLGASAVFAADPPVPAAAPTAPAPVPADVRATMEQIGDLDLLAAMTPLRLTSGQIDKLLAPMREMAREADVKRKKDYELVRALSADVAKARAAMLKGDPLDADLEGRVNKTNAEMEARYAAGRQDAAKKLADTLRDLLKLDQIDVVEAQFTKAVRGRVTVPGDLRKSPEKTKEYVRGLALLWYADRILMPERSLELLAALRASAPSVYTPPTPPTPPAAAPPASGDASAPAASPPPPPR